MATPLFGSFYKPPRSSAIPRSAGATLFMHRMKNTLAPKVKAPKYSASGHPIIHSPIVVRPRSSVHTSSTALTNMKPSTLLY